MFIFWFDSFNQVNSPYLIQYFPLSRLFSSRNPSSPGHHSFIWSIDFINSWEIQVRDIVFVWVVICPKANVKVPTLASGTRIQSTLCLCTNSHAQTLILASYMCTWAWETSGSIFTVFCTWTLWTYCGWRTTSTVPGKLVQWHLCDGGYFSACCSSFSHIYCRRVRGWCLTRPPPLIPHLQRPQPSALEMLWHFIVPSWIYLATGQQLLHLSELQARGYSAWFTGLWLQHSTSSTPAKIK